VYILDTNTLSESMRPDLNPRVAGWFDRHEEDDMYISVVSFGEIARGIEKLPVVTKRRGLEMWLAALRERFKDRSLIIDSDIAITWGKLRWHSEMRGRPPATADLMIAATALRHGFRVVTRNVKDFEPFGVSVINPWDDENGA
jgi:predicted nucleic acid-binding protein